MRLLLDTHVLVWTISDSRRLSVAARKLLGDPDNELLCSVVSLWELAIKYSLRPAEIILDPRLLRRELLDNGFIELDVTGEHAVAIGQLPPLHKDPFDRLLVAQSLVEGITLVTADPRVAQYPGPVRRI
ncbi:MAG TPA: type II toxin-antitoxin system VapC family toxin [Stellaceae bacterium]|nr:type II toxin-antitoxin system VapC family toxin [Stellaceae bacterium]